MKKRQRKNEKLLCKNEVNEQRILFTCWASYSKLCVSHDVDEEIKVNLYRQRSQASCEREINRRSTIKIVPINSKQKFWKKVKDQKLQNNSWKEYWKLRKNSLKEVIFNIFCFNFFAGLFLTFWSPRKQMKDFYRTIKFCFNGFNSTHFTPFLKLKLSSVVTHTSLPIYPINKFLYLPYNVNLSINYLGNHYTAISFALYLILSLPLTFFSLFDLHSISKPTVFPYNHHPPPSPRQASLSIFSPLFVLHARIVFALLNVSYEKYRATKLIWEKNSLW